MGLPMLMILILGCGFSALGQEILKFSVQARMPGVHSVTRMVVQTNTSHEWTKFEKVLNNGDYQGWIIFHSKPFEVYKVTLIGEVDRGDQTYQTLCFISTTESNIVPLTVMKKLAMNFPGTVHVPEHLVAENVLFFDHVIHHDRLYGSPVEFHTFCWDAQTILSVGETVWKFEDPYLRHIRDPLLLSDGLMSANATSLPLCMVASPEWQLPCICVIDLCVDWWPCDLKFCSDLPQYVCGVKTCGQCKKLTFVVNKRRQCLSR